MDASLTQAKGWSVGALLVLLVACSSAPATPTPKPRVADGPVAARRPHDVVSPHGTRDDPYYWLRDDTKQDRAVIAYLEAENAYAQRVLAKQQPLEDELFAEIRARVDEEETSVPVRENGWDYYERYERGKQHELIARKRDGKEQILLDGNELAKGHDHYTIGDYAVSRDGALLAWTDDTVGRLQYTLHVKDIASGKVFADTAANVAPTVVWANDNKTLFFVGRDETTLREDRVMRQAIGGAAELVYKEADAAYYVDISATKSRKYIAIELEATEVTETRLIDADRPAAAPTVFIPRGGEHIYGIEHFEDRFYIRTNDGGDNFRLVSVAPGKQADRKAWQSILAHRDDTFVEDFAVYRNCIAVGVRRDGLRRIHVIAGKRAFDVDAGDPTYVMDLVDTPDPAQARVRYTYDSPTTPTTTFEVDPATGERTRLQQESVPTYDPAKYKSEYVRAAAKDGARIPISIVARKDTPRDGTAPILVLGYGAYGVSLDPVFDRERTSLLDRGWVLAIAHVRGGAELGHAWYDGGRLLEKKHTFTDFIAVTEFLVAQKYAARDRVFAEGGSAGGLLVAAVANMRPDLYRGMIVWVPFVDVVTTMLDESIPLVTNEYGEWGDPREKAAYDYMLSYSPYDNVRAQAYPALYVRTGLHDGLVPYHEAAKWVAKLRATKTDTRPLVFEIDMHAGHRGVSGRYDAIREEARAYAFLVEESRR
jgi:oligopeptidase B